MALPQRIHFVGGNTGDWRIVSSVTLAGPPLATAARLEVFESEPSAIEGAAFVLTAATSNVRYASAAETAALRARQEGLGRAQAICAALIPISKSDAWWALAQDERRQILEETSQHIRIGLEYLPAIARRLHHGRDLGEPFDFLTWFEYAPEHERAFEDLCARLRETEEWRYVTREIDIRLRRDNR